MSLKAHVEIPEELQKDNVEMMSQGAEALVFKITTDNSVKVVKFRPAKPWRIAELDTLLRKRRTTQEVRVMQKLSEAGVKCPRVSYSDTARGIIYMDLIPGTTLKVTTWNNTTADVLPLYEELGRMIAQMHQKRIVHGDLTTSNAMVTPENEVYLIDFGLSSQDASIETMAVDLYVLERAILSTHPRTAKELMQALLDAYRSGSARIGNVSVGDIMSRLEVVRQRGRKRTMAG